jgi:serine-type D-Ala-D-Ala carboxypeptidase (penicillin-binding protein 5/6)
MRIFVLLFALLFVFLQSHAVFAKEWQPEVVSESAILIDKKSGQVLFGKNENERMNPASITKIATAIYAIENGNLNDLVTISENATNVEGTTVYLEVGETISLQQLIIGMFVNSGNDAAIAIAEHIDGDVSQFAKNINQYFREDIGVTNTHFENPHGLYGDQHYTTAADMAEITRYALKNKDFRKVFNMKEYAWNSKSWDTTIVSHHRLLLGEFPYEAEITGGKNGFITESGFTLVTAAKEDDLELIVVTMKTDFKNIPYKDTIQLLDYQHIFQVAQLFLMGT